MREEVSKAFKRNQEVYREKRGNMKHATDSGGAGDGFTRLKGGNDMKSGWQNKIKMNCMKLKKI